MTLFKTNFDVLQNQTFMATPESFVRGPTLTTIFFLFCLFLMRGEELIL